MSQLLKGLAITVGVGLGCTAGSLGKVSPRRNRTRLHVPSPHEKPFIAEAVPASLSDIESRLQEQEAQFRLLQARVDETEKRSAAAPEMVRGDFQQLRRDIRTATETTVAEQVAQLESRLQAEAQESWTRSMAALEQAVERRVADRIGNIEKTLTDQSGSIGALRARAEETDANLQRLIVAVERLCENAAGQPVQDAPPPLPPPLPPTGPPTDGSPANKMFTTESRRPRVPMARIF